MDNETTALEITNDPQSNREIISIIIKALRGGKDDGKPASRQVALAITKLEEARFWLGEAVFGG